MLHENMCEYEMIHRRRQSASGDDVRDEIMPALTRGRAAALAADATMAPVMDGTVKPMHRRSKVAIEPKEVDALLAAVGPTLDGLDEATRAWCDRSTAERFLRADKGDLGKATKRLRTTLKWRATYRPDLNARCPKCFGRDLRSHYMQQVGFDVNGRALVYSDIGLAMDSKASSNVEHCVQVLELMEKFLPAYPYDQYIWVCDFHKFSAGNMNPSVAYKCLSLFARSYPERLEMMIFVEAPKMFNSLYKMLTSFVDPVTVQKLRFVKGPEGKGGGADLRTVCAEHFDDETTKWLITEMRMHRNMWPVVKANKSWLGSMIRGNGKLAHAAHVAEFANHDNRGTPEFIASEAGKYAEEFARTHAKTFDLASKELPNLCSSIDALNLCEDAELVFDRFE
jgi:hypothetical protein